MTKEDSLGDVGAKLRLQTVFWNTLGPGSVAYTVTELLDNLPADSVDRRLWCLGGSETYPRSYHRPVFPKAVFSALCRLGVPASSQGKLARNIVLRTVHPGDIVYVWPPYDLQLIRRARDKGAIVIAERINCLGETSRDLIAPAFARRGLVMPSDWFTSEFIEAEREQMLACNFVTAPNDFVVRSAKAVGISDERILRTSYGFSPARLAGAIGLERRKRAPVFAFVGLGIMRKGLDVLLEAWEQANVNGTLTIAGSLDPEIQRAYQHVLARDDVRYVGFVSDIAKVYAEADVFVFPSHEEGGPQVTYEAAACGLPSIVSPVGAGRIVRHSIEGLHIDPLSVSDVATAIETLATDHELRHTLGSAAAVRAAEYTWSKVGARLFDHFTKIAPDVASHAKGDSRAA